MRAEKYFGKLLRSVSKSPIRTPPVWPVRDNGDETPCAWSIGEGPSRGSKASEERRCRKLTRRAVDTADGQNPALPIIRNIQYSSHSLESLGSCRILSINSTAARATARLNPVADPDGPDIAHRVEGVRVEGLRV